MATNARSTRSRTASSSRTSSSRNTRTNNTRSTRTNSTARSTSSARTAAQRNEASQVREGVTKARNGAVAIVRQSAERALDVPVGAALTARDRVGETVESLSTSAQREKELKSLRTQVTREFNRFERRGGQARRKAVSRVRSTRRQVEREVKSRRREVERQVKQNRNQFETQLRKASTTVQQRVGTAS